MLVVTQLTTSRKPQPDVVVSVSHLTDAEHNGEAKEIIVLATINAILSLIIRWQYFVMKLSQWQRANTGTLGDPGSDWFTQCVALTTLMTSVQRVSSGSDNNITQRKVVIRY